MRNIPVPALLERELGQNGERGCTLRSGRAQGMRSSCIPNEPALIKCSSEGTGDKHCQELAAAPSVPLPRAAAPLMALPEHHPAPCAGQRSTDASSAVPGREARGSCSPVQQHSPKPLPPAHRDSSEAGETWIGDAGGRGCFLVISFICQKESWRYQTSGLCPKLRGICEPQVEQPRVGSSPTLGMPGLC